MPKAESDRLYSIFHETKNKIISLITALLMVDDPVSLFVNSFSEDDAPSSSKLKSA